MCRRRRASTPGARAAGVGAVAAGRRGGAVVLGGGEDRLAMDRLAMDLLGMVGRLGTEHRLRMRRLSGVSG